MYKLNIFHTIKTAILLYIPIALIIIGFSMVIYEFQLREEKQRITDVTKVQVNALRNSLDTELTTIQDDLDYLTEHQALLKYFQFTNQKRYTELETYWKNLAKKRSYYDQIRFIDMEGMEILRIAHLNGEIISTPKSQLQNKATYSYVKQSQNLEKNETYISPFELNIENNQVEIPYKPVIRFIRPVFDQEKQKRGIIVVNYLGKHLLEKLSNYEKITQGQLLLLNKDGYYLRGLSPEFEWGFMFELSKAKSFARAYPSPWKEINKTDSGQFSNRLGLFTFEKLVFPSDAILNQKKHYRKWLLINVIRDSEFKKKITSLYQLTSYVTYGMLLVLVIIVVFWALIRTQKKQTQIALQESQQRSALILNSVAEGIYGIDKTGSITFINPSACILLGYSQEELIGKKAIDMFYSLEASKLTQKNEICLGFAAMQKAEILHSSDIIFMSKKGRKIPIDYTTAPIKVNGKFEEAVITFRDISKRKASEQELTKKATTDALTGSFNRHKFQQLIEQELLNTRRYQSGLSIAIIDIDHFKQVNDTYGHDIGDTTLVNLAMILMNNLRTSDALIRWGGEEFVVICPDTSENGAYLLAEKLRQVVSETNFESIGKLTISIGVGEYQKNETQESFFNRIDKALYEAKNAGRNCVKRARNKLELKSVS